MTDDQDTLARAHIVAASIAPSIAGMLREAALVRGERSPALDAVQELVMMYLPNLIAALIVDLITRREAAGAVTDRFVVWRDDELGQPFRGTDASWELVVDDVAAIIRGTGVGSMDDWEESRRLRGHSWNDVDAALVPLDAEPLVALDDPGGHGGGKN